MSEGEGNKELSHQMSVNTENINEVKILTEEEEEADKCVLDFHVETLMV